MYTVPMQLLATLISALVVGFTQVAARTIPLDAPGDMQTRNVKAERVTYKGRAALRVTGDGATNAGEGERLVILTKTEFQDGVIEIELAGEPAANAGEGARGFVGGGFSCIAGRCKQWFEIRVLLPSADKWSRRRSGPKESFSAVHVFPGVPVATHAKRVPGEIRELCGPRTR